MVKKMKKNRRDEGITLVALVVTIVVLLMLAAVSINMILGSNGIINKSKEAREKYAESSQNDLIGMNNLTDEIEKTLMPLNDETSPYLPDSTFKIVEGSISTGLVIEDGNGNQYVWVVVPRSLYNNTNYNSNNDKPKISLNRKKRMWNRYRNYIAGLAVLVVAVIIVAIVLKSCSNKNSDRQDDTKVTTSPVQQESTAPVIQESKEPAENVTGQTTAAASGRTLSVSGTPETVDYTSSSAYSKAVFIGDFVVSGISQFGFLPDAQVIASNSMTSDKLTGYLDSIVSQSPDSVYIMVGINDLNYGSRSVDDIYKYEQEFIEAVKSAVPAADVYVLSVLPVSQRFESSSKVKQANIDSLNNKFSENAASLGITYIDVASVYKDGSGYFGSSYTDSGYNLKSGYYAFLLNGIAGVK